MIQLEDLGVKGAARKETPAAKRKRVHDELSERVWEQVQPTIPSSVLREPRATKWIAHADPSGPRSIFWTMALAGDVEVVVSGGWTGLEQEVIRAHQWTHFLSVQAELLGFDLGEACGQDVLDSYYDGWLWEPLVESGVLTRGHMVADAEARLTWDYCFINESYWDESKSNLEPILHARLGLSAVIDPILAAHRAGFNDIEAHAAHLSKEAA